MANTVRSLLFIVTVTASTAVPGQAFEYQWPITELIRADADVIQIGNKTGEVIQTLETAQLRLLYAIKTAIEEVAELDTELIIVDGNVPNAFAGAGQDGRPIIGINFGMLKLLGMDPHTAAALLGHETAHLKLEHGEQRRSQAAAGGILSVLGGAVLSGMGIPGAYTLSNLAVAAVQSGYSRENEREADYLGTIWSVEVGFEAGGAARLHEAMSNIPRASSQSFLSTHPSGPERIATLRALAKRLSRGP